MNVTGTVARHSLRAAISRWFPSTIHALPSRKTPSSTTGSGVPGPGAECAQDRGEPRLRLHDGAQPRECPQGKIDGYRPVRAELVRVDRSPCVQWVPTRFVRRQVAVRVERPHREGCYRARGPKLQSKQAARPSSPERRRPPAGCPPSRTTASPPSSNGSGSTMPCCPSCVPGSVKSASDVLPSFLSP